MDLIIEWSEEELNLPAIRTVLREAVHQTGEVRNHATDGAGCPVSPGSDLPEGLFG